MLFAGAALSVLAELRSFAEGLKPDQAGIRLHGHEALRAILASDAIRSVLPQLPDSPASRPQPDPGLRRGSALRAVRAILFDKSPAANWTLGWHQDRTIVVRERHDLPGFGPWSVKSGLQHVEPPIAILAAMLTLRVHLDDVQASNAPLLIVPGSHRLDRIPEREIDRLVATRSTFACLARAGDVWAYATPIVHASAAATLPRRRRVLQVDFATVDLPPPLRWRGI